MRIQELVAAGIAVLALGATAVPSWAAPPAPVVKVKTPIGKIVLRVSTEDQDFMADVARAGVAEVRLGQLARNKGSLPMVKDFGKMMADDHGKANDTLNGLATSRGVTLPSEPSVEQQRTFDRLSKLSGPEFDREYVNVMVEEHQKAVMKFDTYGKDADDADLRHFIDDTLPTLRTHLNRARDLQDTVSGRPAL